MSEASEETTAEETMADEAAIDPDAVFADAAGDSADAGATDSAADAADEEDPWAAALAEQQAAEASADAQEPEPEPPPAVREGSSDVFQPLGQSAANTSSRELDIIMDIPVKLNVELGRTKISIRQLLELAQGSVLELDGLAGDPMDILINGYLIAQGEVVVVEDKYGIRITDIITPSERVKKLNR